MCRPMPAPILDAMKTCCPDNPSSDNTSSGRKLTPDFPIFTATPSDGCCGSASSCGDSVDERPGYRIWDFVETFVETAVGPVPQVKTRLTRSDRWGTIAARVGIGRDRYRIAPGLYAVGEPNGDAPVLVTANYKLTFDALRIHLAGCHAWVLVVETYGVNVWCAAGKGSFSAGEVSARAAACGLDRLVAHRRLILPQLCATGVAAREVKRRSGFQVVWGPVHARDIGAFLRAGSTATDAMRRVSFTLRERVELIPVELTHLGKPSLYLVPGLFLLSGIGSGLFSIDAAFTRGWMALLAYLAAVVSGVILTPAALPWLPGRAFAVKGAGMGIASGALLSLALVGRLERVEMLALSLFVTAVSSFLAMNFTGSTPFTSPTGVEKEMRCAIPAQVAAIVIAVVLWVAAGFMGG